MPKATSKKDLKKNSKASFGKIHLALVFSSPAEIQVSQSECNLLKACPLDICLSQHREKEKNMRLDGGDLHLQNGSTRHLAKIGCFEVNMKWSSFLVSVN